MNEFTSDGAGSRESPPEPGRPELGALDPTGDTDRFEQAVGRIMEAARPELARRREAADPLVYVSSWWRPVVRAAATVVLVSAGLLLGFEHRAGGTAEPGAERTDRTELAEALGVPDALASWVEGQELPDPGELVVTLDADR